MKVFYDYNAVQMLQLLIELVIELLRALLFGSYY